MQLRPYQTQLVTEIRGQYQLGRKAVLAVLPTGGGKTVCFSYIAQAASVKGNRVLILVHRAELLDQASRAMPVPHGIIAANRAMDLSHTVQVASVQTVARRLHLLPRDFFQLVVVDEAHHTTAGTWARVIAHFHAAKLLGVTATPIRGDGRGLGEHYQAMVQGPTAAELTSDGYLAPARVLAPPGFDSAGLRKRMGDFDTKQAEQRVGTIMGDCLGHYRKHLSGQTAIAFCCSVAHAEAVAHLFQSAGIAAASIDGSMDPSTRRELLQRLAVGDLKVLTSCALIGEGVDVPSVGGCILLRPTASVGLHLQMIGRCLRPQPGKTAVVLDHVGNTLRLGHHLEERDWTMDGLKKRDREAAPSVKVCPTCFATSPSTAQVCRDCGHVFAPPERRELRQVEGELVEISKSSKAAHHAARLPWVNDLLKIAGTGHTITMLPFEQQHENAKEQVDFWQNTFGFDPTNIFTRTFVNNILSFFNFKLQRTNRRQRFGRSGKEAPTKQQYYWHYEVLGIDPSKERKRQQGKATDLEALRKLAQQRGYKRGWAERVHQARLAKRHGI
jgi:DNA repair protein RadD